MRSSIGTRCQVTPSRFSATPLSDWLRWGDPKNFKYVWLGFLLTDRRWARALVFISLLALNALSNSFGHISHTHHALIFVAFIFIWLPATAKEKSPATITHL